MTIREKIAKLKEAIEELEELEEGRKILEKSLRKKSNPTNQ